jgi:hypothetical protein
MATKKRAKDGADGMNKTQFILSFPLEMSATEVVNKGKEKGIEFGPKYVWTIRASARKKAGRSSQAGSAAAVPSKRPGRPPKNGAVASTAGAPPVANTTLEKPALANTADESALERTLKKLVLDIGRTRAEEVFRRVQEQVNTFERG